MLISILIALSHVFQRINIEFYMLVCQDTEIRTLNVVLVLFFT